MKPLKHLSKQLTCQLKEFHPPLSIPALYPFVVPLSNKQQELEVIQQQLLVRAWGIWSRD